MALPLGAQDAGRTALANFDNRWEAAAGAAKLDAQQLGATDSLKQRNPGIRIDWDELLVSPRFIINELGFLSGPDGAEEQLIPGARADPLAGDAHRAVKRFLSENSGLFGFDAAILSGARVSREFTTAHNGLRTVVWEQQLDGIPVFEALLCGHIAKNGELVSLSSQFLPALAQAADTGVPNRQFVQAFPPVSAQQAVSYAATNIGEKLDSAEVSAKDLQAEGADKRQRFEANSLRGQASVSLVWLPMNRQTMRLCWRVVLKGKTRGEMYQVLVNAETGDVQLRHCWTFYANPVAYRIFPSESPSPFSPGWSTPNTNQPSVTSRILTNLVAISTNASPDGWITAGRSNTIGNNVDAHLDLLDANPTNGAPVNPPRPTGTTNNGVLTFDFPLDLNQDSTTTDNQKAAQVNAFYWANWMHDKLYDLGFTEAAGNYQQTNFGRGGLGGDAVLIDVQDGSVYATNNAFTDAAPVDGFAGRLNIGRFYNPNPVRDGALDAEWMLHEYTHLLSTRLVGHGAGIEGLQSLGLGEGWSDFFAQALLAEAGDDTNGTYPFGAWAGYLYPAFGAMSLTANYYYGPRRYPYTTQLSKNPISLGDAREVRLQSGIPMNPGISNFLSSIDPWFRDGHLLGEIWCAALWEARAIYISKYGFSNGTDRILRLVMDGMKLGPGNPTYLQARDAILLADRVTTGGVDQTNLWTAFAKRGMGWSAICSGSHFSDGIAEAFDLPPPDRKLWAVKTGGGVDSSPAIGPDGTIYVGSDDKQVYAINPDGTHRWTFSGKPGTTNFNSSPAVALDGTVYMGGDGGQLYAITNGVGKWTNELGGAVFSSPAIGADGTIYVGVLNVDSNIVAFSPNGTRLWGTKLGTFHYVYSSPAIGSDGTVYVGCMDGKVYALNPTNGQVITFYTTGGGIYSSPAIASDGSVYVGSLDGKVYAFTSGLILKNGWPFNIGTNIYCSAAIAPVGTIYIGSDDRRLYALNPDGSQRWSLLTGGRVQSTPAIGVDGTVFFGSYDWRIYSVATNGTTNWTYTTGFNIFSSPVIGPNGKLYVGSADSKLYALPANTPMGPGAWPCFRRNLRHTGNWRMLWLEPGFLAIDEFGGYQYHLYVHGSAGESWQLQMSQDLVTWADLSSAFTLGAESATKHCGIGFYRAKSGAQGSLNAIGSLVITSPPSPTEILMANPFNTADNTVGGLLSNVPEGCGLKKWDETMQSYRTNLFSQGRWSDETMTLRPGEGAFFSNSLAQPLILHLTGEILQGDLSNNIPTGQSLRSSMVPQGGLIQTNLGYIPDPGDTVWLYTSPGWQSYDFDEFDHHWVPAEPALEVGEAVVINSQSAKFWRRRFFVWP